MRIPSARSSSVIIRSTVRFIAFALAGLFAGVAGALAAINFELVNSSAVGAGAVRSRAARRLYRRRWKFHRAR